MLTYSIPTPPPVNNLYANVQGYGRVKSERYRTWRQAAGWEMKAGTIPETPITGPVRVDVVIGDRRGDLDGRIKAPVDLLVYMGVIKDDSQVEEVRASYGGNDPRRSSISVQPVEKAAA